MASKNIKGITIEIGGNTTKLQNALKDVDSIVYKTNTELRSLNQALKLDPKNTELLAQKQDVLKKNIAATTERLNTLKEAQKQMGSYNSLTDEQKENYRALSVEIAKSENALKNMNKELKASSSINLDSLKDGLKKVGDVVGNVAKKMAEVSTVVAGALAGMVAAGVKSYAQLEQNIGGVETLFKLSDKEIEEFAKNSGMSIDEVRKDTTLMNTAIDTVKTNAAKAYKTAGVSANQYMEGVTSFTASLLQSTGGSAIEAANVADMAFRDMSDNANKFGTDMQSIQNAYQGFAKGQYQLLDNLKLGYGGTKTEMERLLADAEKFSGVKYDINNLSDVYNAIHVIQMELDVSGYSSEQLKEKLQDMSLTEEELSKVAQDMGISYDEAMKKMKDGTLTVKDAQILLGTTAKEAETTISGSVNSMKAAFDNFLNGSGSPEALAESIATVLNNIGDAVTKLAPGILNGIVQLVQTLVPQIVQMLVTLIPQLLDAITNMIDSLLNMLTENTDSLQQTITMLITKAVEFITTNLPKIIQAGLTLIVALAKGIAESLPTLIPTIVECIITIVQTLLENLPQIIEAGIELLIGLIQGIVDAIPMLIDMLPTIIETIVEVLIENLPLIVEAAIEIMIALINGLIVSMPKLVAMIPKITMAIINGLIKALPQYLERGGEVIATLIKGISSMIGTLGNTIGNVVNSIINGFKNLPNQMVNWGKDMIQGLVNGIKSMIGKVGDAVKSVANKIKNFLHFSRPDIGPLRDYEEWMPDMVGGLATGIKKNAYLVQNAVKDLSGTMANGLSFDSVLSNVDYAMRGLNTSVKNSVNPVVNPNITYETNYNMMAQAVKEALKDMTIELDDDEVGRFVIKKVSEEVFD